MNMQGELDYHEARRAQVPDLEWDERTHSWVVGDTPDGRRVWLLPLMFTTAIIVGPPRAPWYIDRWCYHDIPSARKAAEAWLADGAAGEPRGWHRHPSTGRRRMDGSEWVEP